MDRFWLLLESFLGSPITWGVVTLVAVALALSGKLSVTAATSVLWIAFATAVFGVYRAEVFLNSDVLLRVLILGCCIFGFAAAVVALNRWMIVTKILPSVATGASEVRSGSDNIPKITLESRLTAESSNLIQFLADRQEKAPKLWPSGPDAMEKAEQLIHYDDGTSRIYTKDYMPGVFALYRELKNRGKEDSMLATMLGMQASVATIRKIADRLQTIAAQQAQPTEKTEALRPKVSNPQPPPPKPAIRIVSEKPIASADSELPCGLELTIVAEKDVSPVALTIKFSGEVGKFYATKPLGMFTEEQGGIIASQPDTILMQRGSPAFTPQQPMIVTVYSKDRIKAEKIQSIPFNFPYPSGYLK